MRGGDGVRLLYLSGAGIRGMERLYPFDDAEMRCHGREYVDFSMKMKPYLRAPGQRRQQAVWMFTEGFGNYLSRTAGEHGSVYWRNSQADRGLRQSGRDVYPAADRRAAIRCLT